MARTRAPLLAQWGQCLPCPGSATVETAGGLLLQGAGVVCSPSVLSLLAQGMYTVLYKVQGTRTRKPCEELPSILCLGFGNVAGMLYWWGSIGMAISANVSETLMTC